MTVVYVVEFYEHDQIFTVHMFTSLEKAKEMITERRKNSTRESAERYRIYKQKLDAQDLDYDTEPFIVDELLITEEYYSDTLKMRKIQEYQAKIEDLETSRKASQQYFDDELKLYKEKIQLLKDLMHKL